MKNFLLLTCLLALFSNVAMAKQLSTLDPLTVAVRTVWDSDTHTVGDAARWILAPEGYQVTTIYPAPTEAAKISSQSIPPSMKMHRTMPVIDALQLLIGTNNTVIIDRQHHLISFANGVITND
ncbi:hypothetical protein [Vibrio algicola]|uniref:hypothetical protein n=1 Tax=Vibrio algicola TaxID=2662262 RepID=UPI0015B54897|nr:hypothetical protein [Vibrio algicola]